MTRTALFLMAALAVLVNLGSGSADATTWVVKQDGSGDATTIQGGINLSATGDVILVFPGDYTGSMNRALHFDGKAILLQSTGGAAVTTIDCQHANRGFDLSAGETAGAIIDGFTIRNGLMSAGGAIRCNGSSPTIRNNVITSCVGEFGAAIYCSSSSAYIHNNEMYSNGQLQFTQGGGIYSSNSSLRIERNQIHNNIGGGGGGIYVSGGVCEIIDNTIANNTKLSENASSGGGIYCSSGTHTIRGNTINGNYGGNGGGIFIEGSGLIENNVISGNRADYAGPMAVAQGMASPPDQPAGFGGGISCSGAITVRGNRITGNYSFTGGGIFCVGNVTIADNLITGNWSWVNQSRNVGGSGGGIYITGGSPLLEGNTISANEANGSSSVVAYGGGIYVDEGCVPTLDRCIVSSNTVTNYLPTTNVGGGIYVLGGMAELRGLGESKAALSTMNVSCSDVWGNVPDNYAGNISDPTGTSCNISEDPLHCGSSPEQ
ncbi:MAG: right-handed parallel beta-helix repeat-containing protein, partial [Candidatus Krumholzibacteria bacterium]|nr:right-handed parallel beta-helix repeat-containing protein [Candidatus Krumholzibacteria bacterium]